MRTSFLLSFICTAAIALPCTAQDFYQPPTTIPFYEQETEDPDGHSGFCDRAIEEWLVIEKELTAAENNYPKQLSILNRYLNCEALHTDTLQLLEAIKVQILSSMLESIYYTAETERDILKGKPIELELAQTIADEAYRLLTIQEIDQKYEEPGILLQHIHEARAEQAAADSHNMPEEVPLTDAETARLAEIQSELASLAAPDACLKHLQTIRSKESEAVQRHIRLQMEDILLQELNKRLSGGIHTTEDILAQKEAFTKVIRYTYPQREQARALKELNASFANPEELLRQIKELEAFINTPTPEAEEDSAAEESDETY